jgi:hypothetical protein
MAEISFERDEDFNTEQHRVYREEGWVGGPDWEVCYYLSCLERTNYFQTPRVVWEAAAKQYVSLHASASAWITRSQYFTSFAVLVLKHIYRSTPVGSSHSIRKEFRNEWVERNAIAHPKLQIAKLATLLKTTVKQIERNSGAMLARREYARLNAGS